MSFVTGTINRVTNAAEFFAPLLEGGKPVGGFAPWTHTGTLNITMTGWNGTADPSTRHLLASAAAVNGENGTFKIPQFAANQNISFVWFNVGPGPNPLYRSQVFAYERAQAGGLEIYLYQPAALGVTAGFVSKALGPSAKQLPGTVKLATNNIGIGLDTSADGADIQFTIGINGSESNNLSVFASLDLAKWDVHVGFPADCKTNAHAIVQDVRNSLSSQDSSLNADITTLILQFLEKPPLNSSLGPVLFELVSVTLTSFQFINHSWLLTNTTDNTDIINVSTTVGYPKAW